MREPGVCDLSFGRLVLDTRARHRRRGRHRSASAVPRERSRGPTEGTRTPAKPGGGRRLAQAARWAPPPPPIQRDPSCRENLRPRWCGSGRPGKNSHGFGCLRGLWPQGLARTRAPFGSTPGESPCRRRRVDLGQFLVRVCTAAVARRGLSPRGLSSLPTTSIRELVERPWWRERQGLRLARRDSSSGEKDCSP
jgi:hypothetical protein